MKCKAVLHWIDRYTGDELSSAARAELSGHLQTCAGCRAQAESHERAESALRTLVQAEPAPDLLEDLRRRLDGSRAPARRWVWAVPTLAVVVLSALLWSRPVGRVAARPPSPKLSPPARQKAAPAPMAALTITRETGPSARPVLVRRKVAHRHTPRRRHFSGAQAGEPPVAEERAPSAQEVIPAEARQAPGGLILLLGEPQPLPSSGSYYAEVSFPDGSTTVWEQAIERGAEDGVYTISLSRTGREDDLSVSNQGG